MGRLHTWIATGLLGIALLGTAEAEAADQALAAADGTALHAVEYGVGANAVVLIHDKGRSAEDWSWFAGKLAEGGYHVLAIDLRGHGTSKTAVALTELDYPKMTGDIAAAVAWLRAHGATKVALIGDKLGANLAIAAAAEDPAITNVVALSPGLNLSGITVSAAVEKYGARPLLLVASADDAYATRTAGVLEDKATGEKHFELLDSAGSGVQMLSREPKLGSVLLAWLDGTFFQKPTVQAAQAGTPLPTAPTATMKTTGEKYGTPAPEKKPDAPISLDD